MPPHTTPEKVMLLHLREFSSAEKCKEYTKILPYQSPTYTNSPSSREGLGRALPMQAGIILLGGTTHKKLEVPVERTGSVVA